MKNKNKIGLLLTIICAATTLTGCNSDNSDDNKSNGPSEERIEQMVTNVIDKSNINAEVEIGPYESMLTGNVEDVPEEDQFVTSSTIFDAPRDFETSVVYNSNDLPNFQAVTNLLSDIKSANDILGTITVKDRSNKLFSKNLLTLTNNGSELRITNPDGYEYGEVYQIEINDAPYLSFKNKSDTIRKLTIEIEDDPNEAATYDSKKLKAGIIDVDLDKVSDKKENQQTERFSFIYDGEFPHMVPGDLFYAHNDEDNVYFNFYGQYLDQEELENNRVRVTYKAPKLNEIYDDFRMKDKQPLNVEDSEILINKTLAVSKFKQSSLARGIVKGLLPYTEYNEETLTGVMDHLSIHVNANMINNRLSTKLGIGVSNVELGSNKSRWFFSLDIGYEKVTDYTIDFDVNIKTKWIFPVGVDYKVKCIEDSQEGFYVNISFTKALQPDKTRDEAAEEEFKKVIEKEVQDIREGKNSAHAWGDDELAPSTSGSRTSWPICQINVNYFAPITMKLQADFYIDAAIQIDLLVKKETFSTKVDFNFTNMSGSDQDVSHRVFKESNWVFALCGSIYIELGIKVSFSLSIMGMYDILRVQAFAEWYVNLSATGMLILDISVSDEPTRVTGYIGLDLAVTAGIRVGLNFKVLCIEETVKKTLWFEYLFRIKWENSIEHFSPIAETNVEMDGIQNKKIDETGILWLSTFNTITMSLQEKHYKADEQFSIFSGKLCPDFLENLTGGSLFTFEVSDPSLIEIKDGVIHVKDGTPNEFTTTFKVHVSNWAGTASDQIVTVHFIAKDTKEVYADSTLIGEFRAGYEFTLPEGPFVYGKEFQAYILDGKEYKPGDKMTMTNETMHLLCKYRILPYYFVYFIDGLGNVVSEQRIMEGESAIEPSASIRDRFMNKDHYTFLNWTCDYSKVMSDLVINSVYLEVF